MSTNETTPAKDPEEWTTGDEPATAAQMSYLETLAHDTGQQIPENLSKADASRLIDNLQDRSPRVPGEGAGDD
jgi:Protein of unknown function (DUF3072)